MNKKRTLLLGFIVVFSSLNSMSNEIRMMKKLFGITFLSVGTITGGLNYGMDRIPHLYYISGSLMTLGALLLLHEYKAKFSLKKYRRNPNMQYINLNAENFNSSVSVNNRTIHSNADLYLSNISNNSSISLNNEFYRGLPPGNYYYVNSSLYNSHGCLVNPS